MLDYAVFQPNGKTGYEWIGQAPIITGKGWPLMDDQTQKDIRSLLKTFGIHADEAIGAHMTRLADLARRNPNMGPVIVRITLEDLTDYGGTAPTEPPRLLEVEGDVTV